MTSNNVTITVYGNLTSGISGGSTPVCYNTSPGTFTATSTGGTGSYTYQWYNRTGIISNATSSTYNPGNITTSTGYYCVVMSGSCGTVTTSITTISVYSNFTSGAIGNTQTICYNTVPSQLNFTTAPTGGTGAYTYKWYNSSGLISGATSSTYSPPALTTTTNYYCAVTSGSCGTLSSNTITINVYSNLTSGVIGNAQTICNSTTPSQLLFTTAPTGATGIYSYQWTANSNQISGATSSTYAPSSLTSTTTYYCAVSSGSCATVSSNNVTITVYANLTSGISGGISPICYNTNPGTFTSTSSGGTGTYTYQWYNGTGIISNATNSTYNPGNLTSTTGFYCVVTSGSCGTVTTSTTTITVYSNLTANISGGTTQYVIIQIRGY